MIARQTKLDTLKINCSKNLAPLVLELQEEILDFFKKYDLYHYHYNMSYTILTYVFSDQYYTYDFIAENLCIDRMSVFRYIKKVDEFIKDIIVNFIKYAPLQYLL